MSSHIEQDPQHTAFNYMRKPIGIPQCAATISRAFRINSDQRPPNKKSRLSTAALRDCTLVTSDEEDIADLTFLFSDTEASDIRDKGKGNACENVLYKHPKSQPIEKSLTDFIPGSLDQKTLPILDSPAYATTLATKSLQRELQSVIKIQGSTPIHELGWYINSELFDNVYQWIVELHSFDHSLPLAKDMRAADVSSVVLELRFGKDYPHSPPFVRVIRPRFLPFTQGGGGHVTGGGAMCMELLTNTGWSAVSSIESVLLQVRMALMNLEPKPARLENRGKNCQRDYGTSEAMDAYIRACHTHGWEIPKDFSQFATGFARH